MDTGTGDVVMIMKSATVREKGEVTIPAAIRKKIGLVAGSILVFELREEGILVRPAIATPVKPEQYTDFRKAEFLLNNAVDADDYRRARKDVEAFGVDPDQVPHDRPE